MKDRVPLYPGRVKLVPVSGQENTYDMVRADEPTQEGDPLSKATFLKDATALAYGLTAAAVPDDVLSMLSRFQNGLGNEYVWAKSDDTGIVGYVNSPDPSAYPPAVDDGCAYTPLGQLGEKVRIATGSYTGTGTYGKGNPSALPFDFEPKLILIVKNGYGQYTMMWIIAKKLTSSYALYSVSTDYGRMTSSGYAKKDGNTVYWYDTSGASAQFNTENAVYDYIVLG